MDVMVATNPCNFVRLSTPLLQLPHYFAMAITLPAAPSQISDVIAFGYHVEGPSYDHVTSSVRDNGYFGHDSLERKDGTTNIFNVISEATTANIISEGYIGQLNDITLR